MSKSHIAYYPKEDCLINLAGNYDYLELPYYRSQDIENRGKVILPTCREMLDAYIPPLFLEKAKLAGLPIPEFYISNGYFEPPAIIDPINPFMTKSRKVYRESRQASTAKSMTRNFTYAMCCQEIPAGAKIKYFRSIMGWTTSRQFLEASQKIWEIFHIPLARVRIIISSDGSILFSDISQLPIKKLGERERAYLEKQVKWDV